MRVEMQSCSDPAHLSHGRWDVAIVGSEVDERGKASIAYVQDHSETVISLGYEASPPRLLVDGAAVDCDDFAGVQQDFQGKSLVLEATSLGVAEVALCCRSFRQVERSRFSILYLEPGEYNAPNARDPVQRRVFDLSVETLNYIGIPGLSFILEDESPDQKVVFLLGYEGERLERAFDQLNINSRNCSAVFGVPAYQAGWEISSFENNIKFLNEQNIQGGGHLLQGGRQSACCARVARRDVPR
jgi:hypothetical protein